MRDIMKAVVFDMDGLMFDTERVYSLAWDYSGEKTGIGKAGHMNSLTLGLNETMVNKLMRQEYGDAFEPKEFRKYTEEFFDMYFAEHGVPVKKGLFVLLDYLKSSGFKIAVASSTRSDRVEVNLKGAGVREYFDAVIGGDMIERSKPEPDIYLKACEVLRAAPEESYALEDSRSGLWSAHRAGCRTIMVPDLWEPDNETLEILTAKLPDLEEVKAFIERENGM